MQYLNNRIAVVLWIFKKPDPCGSLNILSEILQKPEPCGSLKIQITAQCWYVQQERKDWNKNKKEVTTTHEFQFNWIVTEGGRNFFLLNIIFKNSQLWMELWSRSRIRNLPHVQREFAFCLALAQVAVMKWIWVENKTHHVPRRLSQDWVESPKRDFQGYFLLLLCQRMGQGR